jgi:hypothetical protein
VRAIDLNWYVNVIYGCREKLHRFVVVGAVEVSSYALNVVAAILLPHWPRANASAPN